ncbi:class I SAM-dependent methyltransferase [Ktedonosporobacter rubrisoli]|nr:class I SAM-dependent methyltransferase [Ktedonosporobacter rubrisoli]
MHEQTPSTDNYVMGRAPAETRRLQAQSQLMNPATQRMIEQAGITAGMLVLDVGSGAGDVAMLLAERVGPRGSVLGIDIDPTVIETARARVEAAGYTNVSFLVGDIATLPLEAEFDAIVGRLVLVYQPSPTAIVRRLAHFLRPGGIIAFQEMDMVHSATAPAHPSNQLFERVVTWSVEAFRHAGLPIRMGLELYTVFTDAGLPAPHLSGEATFLVGTDWTAYDWTAETTRSLLPLILKFGVATAEEVQIETLAERLRAEALSQRLVVRGPDLIAAWTRIP